MVISHKAKKVKSSSNADKAAESPILESKTKLKDVLEIEFLEDYNPEVLQWNVVKQLQGSILAAGGVEDPILVFKSEEKHFVIDGKHRLAALREIAIDAEEVQKKLLSAKSELDTLKAEFKAVLQKEVDESFEAYRKDQEAKGKPIGTKKEQERFRDHLFDKALKSSESISPQGRKRYHSLLAMVGTTKQAVKSDDGVENLQPLKMMDRTVLDWNVPFKIIAFSSIADLETHYQKNLLEIDKSRAHDLNKINHLIDRYEIFKNRADNNRWSYEKIAAYYKTDLSTVNRVMQVRHVESSIRKFIADNEAANLEKSKDHKYRLKLSNIYRHLSKAGSSKDVVDVDPKKISSYPVDGTFKEKNTSVVLEFMKHEALYGKPHPDCSYIGKAKAASDKNIAEAEKSALAFEVEALIKWGKSKEKYKKVPWDAVQKMIEEYLRSMQ